ncbi:hypothetical protein LCI18_006240 [Fusarium solani-melongenae]|uniref:Uncharacterized protein n=1 Tax=Fusarium solani subsp. cucurbitae TaxID=2747967 RepID=A0ACD3Z2G4_FUSSC|nr:hypothetical protein LCI18_006240 [Fusarium solani-melongenae]
MDPLSIATGCAGLITAIGGLSVSIHTFVRTCREARGDLDSVSRELLSLKTILELIQEDASDESRPFPTTLNQHVNAILANCNLVVTEIQSCITNYNQGRLRSRVTWAINGQGDINKLRSSLEAHKTALEIALDMLALSLTREIRNDTTELRHDTAAIREDTAQILEEIARLQARLPQDAAAAPNNFILQRFFEDMTTYTEQARDAALSDTDANSSKALSFDEGPGEHPAALLQQNSWPYHSMPSLSQQSSRVESGNCTGIQNPYRDSEAASNTSFPTLVDEGHGLREDNFSQWHDSYYEEADKNAAIAQYGIFGYEIPVGEEFLNQLHLLNGPRGISREFTHRRHSTITCSHEEFAKLDITFRLEGFEPLRHIRIILSFSIYPSEDLVSFHKRWSLLCSSICHLEEHTPLSKDYPSPSEGRWRQILVHVKCDTSLDEIDPLVRESLYGMGILSTPKTGREPVMAGNIQAEMFEYTTRAVPYQGCRVRAPIQVILTAYRSDARFYVSGDEVMRAQTGWYHSLRALLGTGMIIEMPDKASEIPERDSGHQHQEEFLYEAWANKRDISGLRTYNYITVTSLRMYLSMPLREKPKPKSILTKILDKLAA